MSYIKVYSTFRQGDLAMIKSILDESSVKFYVANEQAAGMYPLGISMDVMVVEEQAEEVKKIIADYINKTK